MANIYKIREQDLDEELLKRLFSSGNTGIDINAVLNEYLKKTDKINASNIDEVFISDLKKELGQIDIDLSNYREKSVLIGMDDLTSDLSGIILDLQKKIEGVTGGTDLSEIENQLNKIKTGITELQSEIKSNKSLTDEKITILTEDLDFAQDRIASLENKTNDYRLKSEKITEEDLTEDLTGKINAAYESIDRTVNELRFNGTVGEFVTVSNENKLVSSEILVPGYFLTDEELINTLLENKNYNYFFDLNNNIKYELYERKVPVTEINPETGEETPVTEINPETGEEIPVTTSELYYEAIENGLGTTDYKYKLLFDQHTKTLYYYGKTRLYTLLSSGDINTGTEVTTEPISVVKRTFSETSPDWVEEPIDETTSNYSITFDKSPADAVISDVYMLDGTQYRNCIVDIYTTDLSVTIKAVAPFTGYFVLSAVKTAADEELENVSGRLDEINGEVV